MLAQRHIMETEQKLGVPRWPRTGLGVLPSDFPLRRCLLRMVMGHPRESRPAVQLHDRVLDQISNLFGTSGSNDLHFALDVSVMSENVHVRLQDGFAPMWLDFQAEKLDDFDVSVQILCRNKLHGNFVIVGNSFVLASEMAAGMHGVLTRPVLRREMGKQAIVGKLSLEFMMCTPCPDSVLLVREPVSAASRIPQFSKLIGHRGSGGRRTHYVQENTILSFLAAVMAANITHVELDVQLTRDGEPIVFHDFFFRKRDSQWSTSQEIRVAPYSVTFAEWRGLQQSWCVAKDDDDLAVHAHEDSGEIPDDLPSLHDVCCMLPESVGLLIELKYPTPEQTHEIPYPNRNHFVDAVLNRVASSLHHHPRRSIVFLSFDADLCAMLRMKQERFPVLFLNSERRERGNDMKDPRTVSIEHAAEYAAASRLDGMVVLSDMVLENAQLPACIRDHGLNTVLTYGRTNSDAASARRQLELGVDALIADNVALLSRQLSSTTPVCANRSDISTEIMENNVRVNQSAFHPCLPRALPVPVKQEAAYALQHAEMQLASSLLSIESELPL
ncbi:Glycerophosphocholine phosphodiesterase GPCPD1 [Porphyridium purpureum]|uniref:Glycerophosphocholine phosphodiesterase GPCPD1 n=1 Tax=Porphyridium purpureum TaxID=35688 RepID=A0A5J4YU79_PORPP|nr:Glycerophosphocholine phosphodiesterase GPCPD1 [Porphyridium purpureum]|eukprot:POR6137..scf227_4